MKQLAFLLCTALYTLSVYSQQTIYDSIIHDNLQRKYLLYIPAAYTGDTPVPLVLNFHGFGSNAYQQMLNGDFRPIADTAGFLVVHPQGTLFNGITHWNVGGWTIGSTVDDVGFTGALIDSIANIYNIDTTRVYATGMSNGGYMSFLLASQLSEKIAAIASVSGSMTPENYNNSYPQHPIAIMQIHGTADGVVPYNGTFWSKSIPSVLQYWVDFNNCNPSPTITLMPDLDPNDGSTVEHDVYDGGDNEVNVEHFKIIGGSHTWPGSAYGGSGTNYDIDASVEIWKFLSRYKLLNSLIATDARHQEDHQLTFSISPNPTRSIVYIRQTSNFPVVFELYSSFGILVKKGVIDSANQKVDLSELIAGVYFIRMGDKIQKIIKTE